MEESKKTTILVVDDSELNQLLLTDLLESHYTVLCAYDGAQGLEMARHHLPDLIILDIIMPVMDGYAACQSLKEAEDTAHIPIIFITSMDSVSDIQKAFALGAVDYITKPFNGIEVLARTQTHLALKAARESLEKQNKVLRETILEQEINIGLARKVLNYISPAPPRSIRLGEGLGLCLHWLNISCKTEGGDNIFARKIQPSKRFPRGKTIISIKDQSGHAVNCMLRNIITELTHNILINNQQLSLEQCITKLNRTICSRKMFKEDQFFTAITAEIDHDSLILNFVAAGHPPFFLIRGTEVSGYPQQGGAGNNLPVGILEDVTYEGGQLALQPGDKLIFYTDGLPEMPMRHEKLVLGFYELRDLVSEIVKDAPQQPVSRIVDTLIGRMTALSKVAVSATENSSSDDVTVLGLEVENLTDVTQLHLRPADFDSIDAVTSYCWQKVGDDLRQHDFAAMELKVQIALTEAILNAWRHGNGQNNELPITLRWHLGNDVTFEVIDQGAGFNFRCLPDPTDPENITADSGRGIFMIRKCAQHVKWKNGGRHIIVTLQRPSQNMMATGPRYKTVSLWGGSIRQ